MRTFISLLLCTLCCLTMSAYDFEDCNIFYSILSTQECTCAVTKRPLNSAEDDARMFLIPEVTSNSDTHGFLVTTIAAKAFDNCRISALTIPGSVTTVESGAFAVKDYIYDIFVISTTPPTCATDAFTKTCHEQSVLHVPYGSLDEYRNAPGWREFTNIVESSIRTDDGLSRFCVDGIWYKQWYSYATSSQRCKVLECTVGGDVVIPYKVTNPTNGKSYAVTDIDEDAFIGVKLKSIVFPDSITEFSKDKHIIDKLTLMEGQTELEMIVFPKNLKSLGSILSSELSGLKTIYANSPVPYGDDMCMKKEDADGRLDNHPLFYHAALSGKVSLYVPAGSAKTYETDKYWRVFGRIAEKDYSPNDTATTVFTNGDLKFKVLSENEQKCSVTKNGDASYSGSLTIPSQVVHDGKLYSVVDIDNGAFLGCQGLTSVSLPNTLCNIGDSAFFCSGLSGELRIPDVTRAIGSYAFAGCTGLKNIHIGRYTRMLNDGAFASPTIDGEKLKMDMDTIFADHTMFPPFLLNVKNRPISKNDCKSVIVPPGLIKLYSDDYWSYGWGALADKMTSGVGFPDETKSQGKAMVTTDGFVIVSDKVNGDVEIFNTSGQLVYKGRDHTIKLSHHGVFIVRADGIAQKIIF